MEVINIGCYREDISRKILPTSLALDQLLREGSYELVGKIPLLGANPRVLKYKHINSGVRINYTSSHNNLQCNLEVEILDDSGTSESREIEKSKLLECVK